MTEALCDPPRPRYTTIEITNAMIGPPRPKDQIKVQVFRSNRSAICASIDRIVPRSDTTAARPRDNQPMQWTEPSGKVLVVRESARCRRGHGSALRYATRRRRQQLPAAGRTCAVDRFG